MMVDRGREAELELGGDAIEAWNRGDVERILEVLDPEVEVYTPEGLINTGTFSGREAFVAWIEQWNEAWDSFELDLVELDLVGGRHVIATVTQRGQGRG